MQGTLFKVGGSLLNWPDLPARLSKLLQTESHPLLVAGGGAAADAVRQWDATHALGEAIAHQLAINSLTLTAQLLEQLLPNTVCVATLPQLNQVQQAGQIPILLVADFVRSYEPYADIPIEPNWETTSDSLSLWLAWHLGLTKLTLVKSTPWQQDNTLKQAARQGLLDRNFPGLARFACHQNPHWEVSWCNLRASERLVRVIVT